MISVFIVNGPNLASLGKREPEIYGEKSYSDLRAKFQELSENKKYRFTFFQDDSEGAIVKAIQDASQSYDGLIINPGAYSHTSVAVLDAMRTFAGPVIEVHISQIHKREPYRHRMLTAQGADALISGAGVYGYNLAFNTILDLLRR